MTTTAEEPVAGEIVPYTPTGGALEEYRPRIMMTAAEAKEMDSQLRATMLAVLKENTDYGTIPGAGDRKNLLKPGAEKLLQWFGFGSRSVEVKIERDDPESPSGIADKARRIGVTYRTEVTKTIPRHGEVVVATCEGYAGYDEDRYFATAEDARAKAEAKERSWASKDNRQPKPAKWEYITADYRAPWNTLIKMAQKRSYVGAAIDATGAAGLFTQDMEDAGTAAPPALVEAARAEIDLLPVTAKQDLDAWYHALNWPGPGTWDISQWCKALVKAGRLAEQAPHAAPAAEAAQAGPGPSGADAPPPSREEIEDAWLTEAKQQAVSFASNDDGRKLWKAVSGRHRNGAISDEDRARLEELMTARFEDLKKPARRDGLDPEDEWAAKVDSITDADDADAAAADVRKSQEAGHITTERAGTILAAIDARRTDLRVAA